MSQAIEPVKAFSRLVLEERSGVLAGKERWAQVAKDLGKHKAHTSASQSSKAALNLLLAAACDRGGCVTGAGEEAWQCLADLEAAAERDRHPHAVDCAAMLCGWCPWFDTDRAALDTDQAARNETPEVWAFALAREALARVSQP